jgi:LytR cell envelope-related transcriptional attenuator
VHLIQEIGSYAGLAAIPGLAVLSALYFSQARDVRRLREWAGRAPERAAEQAMGGRVVAKPQQAAQPQAAPGAQEAKPAVAAAAATGAAQKTAEVERAGPAVAKPGALTPAAVASAAAGATKTPAQAGATNGPGASGGGGTGTVTRPGPPAVAGRPSTGATLPPRRPIPRLPSQAAAVGAAAKEPDPWYRRLADRLPAGRYVALIVAGALVLGGGAAYGITQLASSDSGGKSASSGNSDLGAPSKGKPVSKKKKGGGLPAIDPSKVTVTVVNGTTIPNLARDTAGKLSAIGFQIGNKVTGTGSLAAAESVVEYRPGAEDEARYVAAKLHISQKQPADQDAIAQAGPAQVIVVLGADQAPGG